MADEAYFRWLKDAAETNKADNDDFIGIVKDDEENPRKISVAKFLDQIPAQAPPFDLSNNAIPKYDEASEKLINSPIKANGSYAEVETPAAGDESKKVSNTAFVQAAIKAAFDDVEAVKNVSMGTGSHVNDLVIEYYDNRATSYINLPTQYFLQGVEYNAETKIITFHLVDGSTFQINISDLVDVYVASASGGLEVTGAGKNEFGIKTGGIVETMLSAAIQEKLNREIPTTLPPSGPAGGDLMGTYPAPKLHTFNYFESDTGEHPGAVIMTDIPYNSNTFVYFEIKGFAYSTTFLPHYSIISFYNYANGGIMNSYSGVNLGNSIFSSVKAFINDGFVCLWIPTLAARTYEVRAVGFNYSYPTRESNNYANRVTSVVSSAVPDTAERVTTINLINTLKSNTVFGGDISGKYNELTVKDKTITEDKLAEAVTEKLNREIPTTLPPSGAAGGDLTGNYPNPEIKAGGVTTDKIYFNAITTDKLAPNSVTEEKLANLKGIGASKESNGTTLWLDDHQSPIDVVVSFEDEIQVGSTEYPTKNTNIIGEKVFINRRQIIQDGEGTRFLSDDGNYRAVYPLRQYINVSQSQSSPTVLDSMSYYHLIVQQGTWNFYIDARQSVSGSDLNFYISSDNTGSKTINIYKIDEGVTSLLLPSFTISASRVALVNIFKMGINVLYATKTEIES